MYTPSRAEFLAAAGAGNLIPVYRELLADGDTPVSAYAALGAGEHSFLLESVVGGATWAAYSFVGVAPRAVVRWQDGTATVTWHDVDGGGPPRTASWATSDPTAALVEVLGELRPVDVPGLPRFWGGAVGWIAYDCVRAFEDLPARARPGPGPGELPLPWSFFKMLRPGGAGKWQPNGTPMFGDREVRRQPLFLLFVFGPMWNGEPSSARTDVSAAMCARSPTTTRPMTVAAG